MTKSKQSFQIFRASTAPMLGATDTMTMAMESFVPTILPTLGKVQAAGVADGEHVRLLFNVPGFSLTHVWFKKNFPLPLHSHDADCLYYIIAGSVKLGSETLGPRDGFFVPADVPYTYKPGADGVELLEFRHATALSFVNHAKSETFWSKALEAVTSNHEDWTHAKMPALNN